LLPQIPCPVAIITELQTPLVHTENCIAIVQGTAIIGSTNSIKITKGGHIQVDQYFRKYEPYIGFNNNNKEVTELNPNTYSDNLICKIPNSQ